MDTTIAYFSAEFGIDSSLPIYSGGLGVLAGDHVKAAHDLTIPLVGVGIFYRKGYFRQQILPDGSQVALYPTLNPETLPMEEVRDNQGHPLIVSVAMARQQVHLRIWAVQVGSVPVYLLDADHDGNPEEVRRLTDSLYGGDLHLRICQEIILGIGGVRALRAIGIKPDVWHMNEGHSAFLALERIREYSAQGYSYETALEAVKATTVFTTHTPVPAGHDQFPFELIDHYLGDYYWQLGAMREQILALGDVAGRFNMTRLAVSMASKVNAVSKLHAEVTKELFHQWKPEIPKQHFPVESITNGIHTKSWLSPEMKALFDRYLIAGWETRISDRRVWKRIDEIPDRELMQAHQQAKVRMLGHLGLPNEPEALFIGFARRFATYKRALLVFQDMERIQKIVQDTERPVVFLFAGKAHPADLPGQELISRVAEISRLEPFRGRVFLLEDFDMEMAKHLVAGVDVWLNTPIKPMEASGTSGQKAAVNGVLNCSILDGWWNEGYNGRNGWAIGGVEKATREEQDQEDSESLYRLLENEIIPMYFDRQEGGYSVRWTQGMKESIRTLTPVFSTSCMVAEYWGKLYIPTAIRGLRFTENALEVASRVAAFKQFIKQHWHEVSFRSFDVIPATPNQSMIHCQVHLGSIWNKDVQVEAVGYHPAKGLWKKELQVVQEIDKGIYLYEGTFAGTRQDWEDEHANIRVIPISSDFSHDYELELVTWK